MTKLKVFLILAATLFFSPGLKAGGQNANETSSNATPSELRAIVPKGETSPDAPDYKIAPLDTLQVRVFLEDALTGEYKVAASGSVTLPLLKRVDVVGLTANQAEERIEGLLGKDFLV